MDSYFNSHSIAAPRRAGSSASNGHTVTGYSLSSSELSTGLEVRTLSMTALPVELVAELIRMRKLWDGAAPARAQAVQVDPAH